jgi:uncharacterized protein (TIGR02145 family)
MKYKTLLSVLTLTITISAFSQKPTIELTFTSLYKGQYVALDSILIENLTQGGDTTLYAPDTVLVLDYITGINESRQIDEITFTVSQNYPNPFKGRTQVNLYLPEMDDIKLTVRDILGRQMAYYENTLNQGNHNFVFYSGNEKYYLLTINGKQTSQTITMINTGSHGTGIEKCKIDYIGKTVDVPKFKSQGSGKGFGYNLGDELMFSAYALTAIGNLGSNVVVDDPEVSSIYEFDIIEGIRCPGMPTITDPDGNTYYTIQIGDQCWMNENLKTTTYSNGTPIPHVPDPVEWGNMTTGAYVWYENDTSMKDKYGGLYNWFTAIDNNGLCPEGWHVPSNNEWTTLTDFLGGTISPTGNKLKSCRQVNSPLGGDCNTINHPYWNENETHYGTDDYGFSGLPGGLRNNDGSFQSIGFGGYWWTSTENNQQHAWIRFLYFNIGAVGMSDFNEKLGGRSIRCLKD